MVFIPPDEEFLSGDPQHVHLVDLFILLVVKSSELQQDMVLPEQFALDTIDVVEPHQQSRLLIPGLEEQFAGSKLHNKYIYETPSRGRTQCVKI